MSDVIRLISASGSDFEKMTPMELKESIFKSEGRVIMGQHLLFAGEGLVRGITNSEARCLLLALIWLCLIQWISIIWKIIKDFKDYLTKP
ncbi:MAG: hypothetical protein V8R63_02835 [Thomasclavelia ramosa]